MPSRKKTGKARKPAKAKAEREEEERIMKEEVEATPTQATDSHLRQQRQHGSDVIEAFGSLGGELGSFEKCKHGFAFTPEEESLSLELIEKHGKNFRAFLSGEQIAGMIGLLQSAEAEASEMDKVTSYLLCIGAEHIILDNFDEARVAAYYTTFFEHVAKSLRLLIQGKASEAKMLEPDKVDEHTVVRFFQKRIPCACLDEKYEGVKCITKMSLCINLDCKLPGRTAVRSKMFSCTSCNQACYCSKECQKVDWEMHKQWCSKRMLLLDPTNGTAGDSVLFYVNSQQSVLRNCARDMEHITNFNNV